MQDEHGGGLLRAGYLFNEFHQVGGAVQVVHFGNERAARLLRRGGDGVLPLGVCLGGALPLPTHNGAVRTPRKHTVHTQLGRGLDGEQVAAVLRERLHQVDGGHAAFCAQLLHLHAHTIRVNGGDRTECAAAGTVTQVDAFAELKALDEGVLAFGTAEHAGGAGGECVVFFRADVEDGGAHGSP